MLKTRVVIGRDLLDLISTTKAKAAAIIAVKVKAEFNTLLMTAPQYSGNYVANMRIDIGYAKKTSAVIRPYKKYPKRLKAAATMPPINRARKNSDLDTLEARFVAHALKVPVWNPQMLVYNNLREAEYIEGMDSGRLREPNKLGVDAMQEFRNRVANIHVVIKVKVT